jgi:hypothetical protein
MDLRFLYLFALIVKGGKREMQGFAAQKGTKFMVYTVSTRKYLGDHATIVTHDDQGREIPVLHFIPADGEFPGDVAHLAANLASLLNGNEPLYQTGDGRHDMFWVKHDNGIELRIRERTESWQ